ncbi:DUF2971 domain-containing protein [Chryseobacterium sp. ISL-6]|uniref:DUF2971 domain-containing protein n=1 Tax=Chryseobacterium sp. ISL-6 TaxID=2819143 RepID=UPI001BE5EA90
MMNIGKNHYEKYVENVNRNFGIYSLTTKNSNLLMWSHYGNSHKGFCIGFNTEKLFKLVMGTLG